MICGVSESLSPFALGFPKDLSDLSEEESSEIPDKYALHQNYPNPFNPVTVIGWQLADNSHVKLSIYNILGQKVATLVNKKQSAGRYKAEWDASGFASGIYFYQIKTDNHFEVRKMMLMK
jgi:hypothetical protein